jgi:hypothetical protein
VRAGGAPRRAETQQGLNCPTSGEAEQQQANP